MYMLRDAHQSLARVSCGTHCFVWLAPGVRGGVQIVYVCAMDRGWYSGLGLSSIVELCTFPHERSVIVDGSSHSRASKMEVNILGFSFAGLHLGMPELWRLFTWVWHDAGYMDVRLTHTCRMLPIITGSQMAMASAYWVLVSDTLIEGTIEGTRWHSSTYRNATGHAHALCNVQLAL